MCSGLELFGEKWCPRAYFKEVLLLCLFYDRGLAGWHQFRIKQSGVREASRRSRLKFQLPLLWLAHVIGYSQPEHVASPGKTEEVRVPFTICSSGPLRQVEEHPPFKGMRKVTAHVTQRFSEHNHQTRSSSQKFSFYIAGGAAALVVIWTRNQQDSIAGLMLAKKLETFVQRIEKGHAFAEGFGLLNDRANLG